MLIKICGLREPQNIDEIIQLEPDMIGFIFYKNSPRYAKKVDKEYMKTIPKSIKKVGVFVNEKLENILTIIRNYSLDAVQLHGSENHELCKILKEEANIIVIKVFSIMDAYNFKVTKEYEDVVDYFLFDTKTDLYGGSGKKFNWKILNEYRGTKDFILSGGIELSDAKAIRKIEHPRMIGLDLNSKFEIKPGLKNLTLLKEFLYELSKPIEEDEDEDENENMNKNE